MQEPWEEHFNHIVIPAWQAYRAAETRLTEADLSKDADRVRRASYDALREGGAAALYVHHFADVIFHERPTWLPAHITHQKSVYEWLDTHCRSIRSEFQIADATLLCHVADTFKHWSLRDQNRDVSNTRQLLWIGKAYGEGIFGEGKMGQMEVVVAARSGKRVLSSILQNVIDAWRVVAGFPLPPLGAP